MSACCATKEQSFVGIDEQSGQEIWETRDIEPVGAYMAESYGWWWAACCYDVLIYHPNKYAGDREPWGYECCPKERPQLTWDYDHEGNKYGPPTCCKTGQGASAVAANGWYVSCKD